MSIDWITVAAQIVNFLILIWLLKRFLYRPVLDGIDAREAEIAARMGEAAALRKTAEAKEAEYRTQIADLSASRAEMLETARHDAEKERDQLLADARGRAADEQSERDARRLVEAKQYTADLHQIGAEALLSLTRKALADLADETLEHRIALHAVAGFKEMADQLREAAGDNREAVALTRDPLPKDVQSRLREDLALILPGFDLRFDVDPALSPGLNLRLGGAQVGWTIDSYLNGLNGALQKLAGQSLRKSLTNAA